MLGMGFGLSILALQVDRTLIPGLCLLLSSCAGDFPSKVCVTNYSAEVWCSVGQ